MPPHGKKIACVALVAALVLTLLGTIFSRAVLVEQYHVWRLGAKDFETRSASVQFLIRSGTERSVRGLWTLLADLHVDASESEPETAALSDAVVGAIGAIEARSQRRAGTLLLELFRERSEAIERRSAVLRFLMRFRLELLADVFGAMVEQAHESTGPDDVVEAPSDATVEYETRFNAIPPGAAFRFACETLSPSLDPQAVAAALRDLLALSKELDKVEDALSCIERFLEQTPEGSVPYQNAFLARASLLHSDDWSRSGAARLFREAFFRGWKTYGREDALHAYKLALAADEPAELPVRIFNLAAERGESPAQLGDDHLSLFGLSRLWPHRRRPKNFSAISQILPRLAGGGTELARATCLLLDRRYDESLKLYREVDRSLSAAVAKGAASGAGVENPPDEWRNLPLYIATVELLKNSPADRVHATLSEFSDRNRDRPHYVCERAMRICAAVYHEDGHGTDFPITSFLVEKFFTDPAFVAAVQRSHFWHIVDVFVTSARTESPTAFDLRSAAVDAVDPTTLAARHDSLFQAAYNHMLFWVGRVHRELGELEAAEAAMRRMLALSAYGRWNRVARSELIQTLIARDEAPEKIAPLTEALEGFPDSWSRSLSSQAMRAFRRYEAIHAERGDGGTRTRP